MAASNHASRRQEDGVCALGRIHAQTVIALRAKPDMVGAFMEKACALGGSKVKTDPGPL
jgi:hypothetical protein